jgi:hypothetical protein
MRGPRASENCIGRRLQKGRWVASPMSIARILAIQNTETARAKAKNRFAFLALHKSRIKVMPINSDPKTSASKRLIWNVYDFRNTDQNNHCSNSLIS